jgi:hypothetical protein
MSTSIRSSERRLLFQILTLYSDALVLKDLSAIPVSSDVRITSNGRLATLGNGTVWHTPGALRLPYRRTLVDTNNGAAILRATVTNETVSRSSPLEHILNPPPGQWWWYVVRLKVVGGLITEIEEIVSDIGFPGTPASSLRIPDRMWDTIVPEEQRSTPEQLQQIADDYFNAVSGTIPWHQAPFHPECNRYELGSPTTNAVTFPGGVGTGLLSPTLQGLQVTNRRFYVVDPTLGVVGAMAKFTPPKLVERGAVSTVVWEEAFFALGGQDHSNWGTGPWSIPPTP